MDIQRETAKAILKIGAVGFKPNNPITFKSGILSPVYVDNRKFPFNPEQWRIIIDGFKKLIEEKNIEVDVYAGVEAAGIPHSAALGFYTNTPSVFVRKEVKDHGTVKRVEGGDVFGKKVVLIEDLVTTGGSSLSVVEALRAEEAKIDNCLVIVSYGFQEGVEAFKSSGVILHALTTFSYILDEAFIAGMFSQAEKLLIEDWFNDPHGWAGRHGFNNKL